VSSNGVLHHTPDMPAALREIRRVLVPGGRATIIVYHRASIHYWLHQVPYFGILRGGLLRHGSMSGVLEGSVETSSIGARPLVRVYSARELREMLEQAGLSDVRCRVRHLDYADTIPTALLGRVLPPRARAALAREVLDRLATRWGWYLVGSGVRAA
jgi:ubiquinone/menaquinone biosynthesis C-methylase UbiE